MGVVSLFLRGILIGLLFGVPVGAVGAMTVQRTFHYGVRAGLLTGLGSSIADCFYACVGAFGLTLVSDFLLKGRTALHCAGGCLVLAMGIGLLCKKDGGRRQAADAVECSRMFLSSFVVGMTNPAAILTFLFAFSWFGISGNTGFGEGFFLVSGVFAGTYFWWGLLTAGTRFFKRKARYMDLQKVNGIFGVLLSIFGLAALFLAVRK